MLPHRDTLLPLPSLQLLRAVAALMVLLLHLGAVEAKYGGGGVVGGWSAAGQYGVDLFFVISGFVMVYSTRSLAAGWRASLFFLARRAWRIYPNYWLFTSLVVLVMLWRPEWVNESLVTSPDLLRSYLLLPQHTPPLLAVGWSLVFELYFYLMFAALLLLPGPVRFPLLLLWFVALAGTQLAAPSDASPIRSLLLSPFALEFLLGAFAAYGWSHHRQRHTQSRDLALSLAVFLLACWGLALLDPAPWLRAGLLGSTGAVLVFVAATQTYPQRYPALALRIGDASYTLYLSHVLVLSALGHAWRWLGATDSVSYLVWIVGSVAASIAFSLYYYRWVEKPLLAWGRRKRVPESASRAI